MHSHRYFSRFMPLPWLWIITLLTLRSLISLMRHFLVLGLPKNMSRAMPNALRNPKFRPPLTACGPTRSCPAGRVNGAGVGRGVYVPAGTVRLGLAGSIRETTVDGRPAGRPLGITSSCPSFWAFCVQACFCSFDLYPYAACHFLRLDLTLAILIFLWSASASCTNRRWSFFILLFSIIAVFISNS